MKVLIAAGGTGGHFYPGLSVAKELLNKEHQVVFLVRENDFVIPLLEKEKIPFRQLSAAGFVRKFSIQNIFSLFKVLNGVLQAFKILSEEKPDRILVMGGYLSFAPALVGRLKKIPVLLHEQNVVPGLANRILNWITPNVAVSFEESQKKFKGHVSLTGNPIREDFFVPISKETALKEWGFSADKKTLLVFGGSLGAKKLNTIVTESLLLMGELLPKIQVLHFTGLKDESRVKALYAGISVKSYVSGYCHDMPKAYAVTDFVVCRSGASTVSELIGLKIPSMLVPYPFATNDHQTANAETLSKKGAALLIQESDLTAEKCASVLRNVFLKDSELENLREGFTHFKRDPWLASARVVQMLTELTYS